MPTARRFFSASEQQQLVDAISQAELNTSGEIRLHLENFCFGNELERAKKVFVKLQLHRTRERNGVLIYMATLSRKIAIIGDEGIHSKLGTEFWNRLVEQLIGQLKKDRKADALAECIVECGKQLGKFFPLQSDDTNELSNDISFN